MSSNDLITLLPLIVPSVAAVVIMLAIAYRRDHRSVLLLTIVGLLATLGVLFVAPDSPVQVTRLVNMDGYARFFMELIIVATLVITLSAYGYLKSSAVAPEEFYLLLLLATLGAQVLAVSNHFASFFLGLELLSVSLYALIAYPRFKPNNVEAGLKYLVLAAASAAFLLFGMALIYAETGTMEFSRLNSGFVEHSLTLVTGLAMLVVGIGFKLAVVPFHLWTPDVYQGAPAPVTTFVSTVSKGAMVALLLRFLGSGNLRASHSLMLIFSLIAGASMLFGNLLALLENNVKRLLAYSSIAHFGYILVAFIAGGEQARVAVTVYLVAYFITMLMAFGTVTVLSDDEREADMIEDYRALFWRNPWLGCSFAAALLSLAGIPLTAGFIGKFYILVAGVGSGRWTLLVILVGSSVIGLFYYLRLLVVIFSPTSKTKSTITVNPFGKDHLAMTVLLLCLLYLGLYPVALVNVLSRIFTSF